MPRLPPLNARTPEQDAVWLEIARTRRGPVYGPFEAWLRSPEFAARAQHLGEFCRYRTSLPNEVSELAILLVAAHHKAEVEWFVHAPIAETAGLGAADIDRIRRGEMPAFADCRLAVAAKVVCALIKESRLSDSLFEQARAQFGESALVELVGVVGYYTLVAYTLNVFEIPLPEGAPAPFSDAPA